MGDTDLWPQTPFTLFDVYFDGVLAADNIDELSALPMTVRDAGVVSVAIAPNSSTSVGDAFRTLSFELFDGDSVAAVLVGFLNPSNHPQNPDGLDTSLRLLRVPKLRDVPRNSTRMEMRLVHATPTAESFVLVNDWPVPTDTAFVTGTYGWFDDYKVVGEDSTTSAVNYWAVGLHSGSQYCQVGHEIRLGAFLAVTSGYVVHRIGLFTTGGERIVADGLCPVDIEDPPRRTSRASVFAFPNPATSTVTVRVVGDVPGSNVTVELYDMTGRRLARHFGTMGSVDVSLPFGVSSLPSGVYHAKVYTDSYRGIMAATTQIVIVH